MVKSASVSETSLFSQFKVLESQNHSPDYKQRFKHGQYERSGIHGTFGVANRGKEIVDDHQVSVTSVGV